MSRRLLSLSFQRRCSPHQPSPPFPPNPHRCQCVLVLPSVWRRLFDELYCALKTLFRHLLEMLRGRFCWASVGHLLTIVPSTPSSSPSPINNFSLALEGVIAKPPLLPPATAPLPVLLSTHPSLLPPAERLGRRSAKARLSTNSEAHSWRWVEGVDDERRWRAPAHHLPLESDDHHQEKRRGPLHPTSHGHRKTMNALHSASGVVTANVLSPRAFSTFTPRLPFCHQLTVDNRFLPLLKSSSSVGYLQVSICTRVQVSACCLFVCFVCLFVWFRV